VVWKGHNARIKYEQLVGLVLYLRASAGATYGRAAAIS